MINLFVRQSVKETSEVKESRAPITCLYNLMQVHHECLYYFFSINSSAIHSLVSIFDEISSKIEANE